MNGFYKKSYSNRKKYVYISAAVVLLLLAAFVFFYMGKDGGTGKAAIISEETDTMEHYVASTGETDGEITPGNPVDSVRVTENSNARGAANITISLEITDPSVKKDSIRVALLPKDSVRTPYPRNKDGSSTMLGESMKVYDECSWKGSTAQITLDLEGEPETVRKFVFQVCWVDPGGVQRFQEPLPLEVTFYKAQRPGAVSPAEPSYAGAGEDDEAEEDEEVAAGDEDGTAGEGWMEEDTETSSDIDEPGVTSPGKSLLGEPVTVADAAVSTIDLPAKLLADNMFWGEDGKSVYILNTTGKLYRLSVPGFELLDEIDLKGEASDMKMSREGLVIVMDKLQEVRLFDLDAMTFTAAIPSPGVYYIGASPNSGIVFAVKQYNPDTLTVIDMELKSVAAVLDERKVRRKGILVFDRKSEYGSLVRSFKRPTVTGDGTYLFCVDGEALHRFRIDGSQLSYEEVGPSLGGGGSKIIISPDDQYVAYMVNNRKNARPAGHPDLGIDLIFIYNVTDLAKPVFAYPPFGRPGELGFDKKNQMLYISNSDFQLITLNLKGERMKEYSLSRRGGESRQLLVHPSGKKILVLTREELLWVVINR